MEIDKRKIGIWLGGLVLAILVGWFVPFMKCDNADANFGRFYDGTVTRDSVWMNIATFDTLGYEANADSVWFIRYFRTTVIDTSKLSGAGNAGTAHYTQGKRAFDGTNYGEYTVKIRWKTQTKYFTKPENYTVFPESLSKVGTVSGSVGSVTGAVGSVSSAVNINSNSDITAIKGQTDKLAFSTGDSLTKIDRSDLATLGIASVSGAVGSVTSNVNINSNSDITAIKGQTDKFVFSTGDSLTKIDKSDLATLGVASVSGAVGSVASGVTVSTNNDKIGYALTTTERTAIAESIVTSRGVMQRYNKDAGDSAYVKNAGTGASAAEIWGYSGAITLTDTIPKVYAVNAGASDPDTTAKYVWTYSSRTLTSGSGTGTYEVKIITKQSSDSSEIVGATVQVLNSTQSSTIGLLSTGSNGDATFALDADTFKVRMYKPGWQFVVPETAVVSNDTTITYYADIFNPGNPPSADLCRVYGWIKDINNLPVVGAKVEAKVKIAPLRFGSIVISPYYKIATTDSDGYWYLDLYPNIDLTPNNTKYQFFIYSPAGTILNLAATVPHQGSWELSF
jgi:hypothetical protein